ncbi:acetyl-CoA acyltransferase 2 [Chamberlinius hualienensis]
MLQYLLSFNSSGEVAEMCSHQREVCIVSAVRTPVGSLCGKLSTVPAHKLGAVVIKEAVKRANVAVEDVDEVIFGHVLSATEGQNPVRQAVLSAGLPNSVPAWSINMLCGSGMKSVTTACQSILNGDSKCIIAGGQESMSRAPHATLLRIQEKKLGDISLTDTMLVDGLTDAFGCGHMGETAENIARDFSITREEQDKFAESSQKKYGEAKKLGHFDKEIVPVPIPVRGGQVVTVTEDEFPKVDTSFEKLSKLRPAFLSNGSGTVTPGNASGINDGAAALLLMSSAEVQRRGLNSLGKVVAWAQVGLEPRIMGMGPVKAIQQALVKAGWKMDEVDLFEINEAFAAQAIAVNKELKVDLNKVNVNGGAIAIGHPIGASGARILVTLLHSLERINGKKGVASLCIGGGMGLAVCVERN